MPNRILKESICVSEDINELTAEQEVFFYRLMVNCDDYGRMDARPEILRAKCFPLKIDKVKPKDIEAWMSALIDRKMVGIYHVGGKPYLQLLNWGNHQQVRAKRSKFPEPDSDCFTHDINCNQMQSDDDICTRESESEYENPKREYKPAESPTTPASVPVHEVITAYNHTCESLPKAQQISDKRKAAVKARLKDHTLDQIVNVFEKAEASDFLSGRNGKWPGCNLDWLIAPNNFIKVLEGTYDNKPDQSRDSPSSSSTPTPEQAWREVSSNLDPTKRHTWSHDKIAEAVKTVGLRVLFGQYDLAHKKTEFIKAYQGGG